jgi:arylsulfatase A-like enzyme
MSSRSGRTPRGVLGETVVTGVSLGVAFALVDLWQVALVSPASLQPSGIGWLLGLYTLTALGGALVTFVLLRLAGVEAFARRVPAARAFLVAVGVFLLAQEVALRALEPLSPWRPWAVVGVAVAAVVVWLVGAALFRTMRLPAWVGAVAGLLLLAGGSYGAVRGFGAFGTATPAPTATGPVTAGAERPNVVFILIDTLRADHLGAYGYARPTSPVLDAFAAESVLFESAFSQSSWTKPATASLLTSRYPSQHQCFLEKQQLPASETTLPQYLQRAGYTTAMLSGNPWVTPDYGFDRGTDHFFSAYDERFARVTLYMMALKRLSKLVDAKARPYNRLKLLVQGEMSSEERDQVLTKEAFRWLDANTQEPFFLYLHYMSPHHPYEGVPPYDKFVPDPSLEPVTYYPTKSYYFFEQGEELPDAQREDMVARYDGDILHIDGLIGELLGKLRELKLEDETLVVVTSDHGEEFFDHRNWGHGQSIYNELIHVPLIIRFPKRFTAGRRVSEPVQTIDVLPTLLELAGAPLPSGIAGKTLLPVLRGEDATPREAYSELLYRYGDSRSLVRGGQKLMRTKKGEELREEVFDLGADPREQRAAAVDGNGGAALQSRLTEVQSWAEQNKTGETADAAISDEQKDRLKALGYMN